MANEIKYRIVDGELPTGLELNEDTGKFEGAPTWEALGLGPTFTGPSDTNLGTFDAGDVVSYGPITATSDSPVTFGLTSAGTGLPWGLTLDGSTGLISGTLAEPKHEQKVLDNTRNGPKWNTEFGKLADLEEGQSVTINLSTTPYTGRTIKSFDIVRGGLPWGLTMDFATGQISGNAADLKNPGLTIETPKLPTPSWNSTVGTIGIVEEGAAFEVTLSATPASGRTMAKYSLRQGALPWGLTLNTTTGVISGTVAELRVLNDPAYYEGGKDPQISGSLTINGTDTPVAAGGSLGSFAKGSSPTIQLSATPYAGRSMARYVLVLGTLPWGLQLDIATGLISGTIHSANAVSGTYNITIRAIDSAQASAARTYTLTVQ